ncbi:MAG: hypothetical protein B6D62_03190 [Candidatus Cloacimonas sp. 4484_275]|nr:MAG: hypothetical protein B6D62_03190 [Candidatus Cloacimonas sp. 4484_275]
MKKTVFYVFYLGLLFLFSCSSQKTTENNPPDFHEEIVPLALENNWNYTIEKVLFSCIDGELHCEHYDVIDTTSALVTSSLEVNYENETFPAFVIEDLNYSSFPFVYRNTAEGLIEYGKLESNGEIDFEVKLKVKFPIQTGETWKEFDEYYGDEFVCVSEDDTLTTAAGTFHCYVFELIDESSPEGNYTRFYYKPGIGLIAEIRHKEIYVNASEPVTVPEEYQDWYVKKLFS